MLNVLTIDVEEYFHPTELTSAVRPDTWGELPSRVEIQTLKLLELLERHRAKATFFVLGWVAERHPALVRSIASAGHEIGCHSYAHRLIFDMTPEDFRSDTNRAVAAIADAYGAAPRLYRAPSYSITGRSLWALDILADSGFTHDSSIYPISHDRYGIPGFPRHPQVMRTTAGPIFEVPIATALLSSRRVTPVGGGGYLRLLPYAYTAAGIRRINELERQPACVYFHPWELDADHPRLASGWVSRLRTYSGLRGMPAKIVRLLSEFRFAGIGAVHGGQADEQGRAATPRRAAG